MWSSQIRHLELRFPSRVKTSFVNTISHTDLSVPREPPHLHRRTPSLTLNLHNFSSLSDACSCSNQAAGWESSCQRVFLECQHTLTLSNIYAPSAVSSA